MAKKKSKKQKSTSSSSPAPKDTKPETLHGVEKVDLEDDIHVDVGDDTEELHQSILMADSSELTNSSQEIRGVIAELETVQAEGEQEQINCDSDADSTPEQNQENETETQLQVTEENLSEAEPSEVAQTIPEQIDYQLNDVVPSIAEEETSQDHEKFQQVTEDDPKEKHLPITGIEGEGDTVGNNDTSKEEGETNITFDTQENIKEEESAKEEHDAQILHPDATEVSEGPYYLIDLLNEIQIINLEGGDVDGDSDTFITYIEAWDMNLYIGTNKGEIIHMYKIDEEMGYIVVSRQKFNSSKVKPISKILLLPKLLIALVLCGSVVMAYNLPELSPANIGKMKDVTDMSIDNDDLALDENKANTLTNLEEINGEKFIKVTVFTKKSIRMIRVFQHSIKLFKDVHYPQSLSGASRSNFAAVSSSESYDLIDLSNVQRIPLFPLSTVENNFSLRPFVLPLGKSEFMMCCGGSDESDNSMGMIINTNGDISRGTIPWDSYPCSLAVDFPYSIAVFDKGSFLKVHSLDDQLEVQNISFPSTDCIKVQSVSHLFTSRNDELERLFVKSPLFSNESVEESEKSVLESEKLDDPITVSSSVLIYDINGRYIQILQLFPSLLKLIKLFGSVSEDNYAQFNKTLTEELKAENQFTDMTESLDNVNLRRELIYTLLGISALKFQRYDQCFELWCNPQNGLDPRLFLYLVLEDTTNLFGTLWQFEHLFDEIKNLRENISKMDNKKPVEEFTSVFLNTWVSNFDFIKDESIMKSLEMSLIVTEISEAVNEIDIIETLKNVKVCKHEAIDFLQKEGRYYFLAKYYESLKNHRQFLYYWSNLLKGDIRDTSYDKIFTDSNKQTNSLKYMVNYLTHNCSQDEETIFEYGEWLVLNYPSYGLKLFTSPALEKVQLNDLKVLQIMSNPDDKQNDLVTKYLEHIIKKKNQKQFYGDYILNLLEQLFADPERMIPEIDKIISKYHDLKSPKMPYIQFLKIERNKNASNEILDLVYRIVENLMKINHETISLISRKNIFEEVNKKISSYEKHFPYLSMTINYQNGDYKKVIELLCDLGDFTSAERFAKTLSFGDPQTQEKEMSLDTSQREESENLLLIIFDYYLKLEDPKLIEKFLNNHNIITSSAVLPDDTSLNSDTANMLEAMDRFIFLINRIPNNFPVSQIQNFLTTNMINFENKVTDFALLKSISKAENSTFAKCLHDFQNNNDYEKENIGGVNGGINGNKE